MDKSTLSPTSYIILGFIDRFGTTTSYDLKQWADNSVGYFWSFSRAQLYKEPARLEKLKFLSANQESNGRKRRLYEITKKGSQALREWLNLSTYVPPEFRDIGLLKLYFGDLLDAAGKRKLIEAQIQGHQKRLLEFQLIENDLTTQPEWRYFLATVELGLRYERTAKEFWEDLEKNLLD